VSKITEDKIIHCCRRFLKLVDEKLPLCDDIENGGPEARQEAYEYLCKAIAEHEAEE